MRSLPSASPPPLPRDRETFEAIWRLWREGDYPPTLEEVGRCLGLSSRATVSRHVNRLVQHGHVAYDKGRRRTLRPLVRPSWLEPETIAIPLVGRVAAGDPLLITEDHEHLEVPASAVLDPGNSFAYEIRGDSMIDAGIVDGDFAVCEGRVTAPNGTLVVARIEDDVTHEWEVTVKFLRVEGRRVLLEPANSSYYPMEPKHVGLVGVVRNILRPANGRLQLVDLHR